MRFSPRSLSFKAFIAIAIALLPLPLSFFLSYNSSRDNLRQHVLDDLTLIAGAYECRVDDFMGQARTRAADFAASDLIRRSLATPARLGADGALQARLRQDLLPQDRAIRRIMVVGPDGRIIASTNRGAADSESAGRRIVEQTRRAGGAIIANRDEVMVSAPVRSASEGRFLGVVVNVYPIEALDLLLNGFSEHAPGAGPIAPGARPTIRALLVDRSRTVLTSSVSSAAARLRGTVVTSIPAGLCADGGSPPNRFLPDAKGATLASAVQCIQSAPWALVVQEDAGLTLWRPLHAMRRNAIAATAVVGGIIMLFFALFSREVIVPLRRMSRAAGEIAAGNYGTVVPVQSTDEIGTLSRAFNEMTREIESRTTLLRQSAEDINDLYHNAPIGYHSLDRDGVFVRINDTELAWLGYAAAEIIGGMRFRDVLAPSSRESFERHYAEFKERGWMKDLELEMRCKDGRTFPVLMNATAIMDASGKFLVSRSTIYDITDRKKMEDAVRESEEKFRAIFNSVHDGILVADAETRKFVLGNETITRMLGYSEDDLLRLGLEDIHPAEDVPFNAEQFEKVKRHETALVTDVRIKRKDGSIFLGDVGASPLRLQGKEYLIGIFRDLTEQKRTEEELRKLSAVIEHSVNVLFITDREGAIEYANPTFETVTGWSRDEVIGQNPRILSSGSTTPAEYQELWSTIIAGKTWRGSFKNRRKDGTFYWGSSVITPIKNDRGEITHFLAVQEDVTERKRAEERIQYLAAYDELTGLINRSRFMTMLEEWIAARDQEGAGEGCLFLIDIDEFKFVNDAYGHATGDELIRRIGGHLRRTLRDMHATAMRAEAGFFLGRMGGDEFAAFLPGVTATESTETAERIRGSVAALRLMEGASHLTVSIGMAEYPEQGLTVKELFTKADAALYHTKRMGKNKVRLFRPEDRDLEFIHSRVKQKERIQTAIYEDRFLPWFQPILNLHTGVVDHYEALARLRNEDGSILLPNDFIETAEIFGLIGAVDRIIMEKTMRLQAQTMREGRSLTFGMNLSGREFGEDDSLVFLQDMIRATGADPTHLVFEITETAAVRDLDRAIRFVNALKALGCRFALDDFGVGFTSFLYLREMGVDYIKIDGSFIRNVRESKNDQLFVRAIRDVAAGMGIQTIAEFVEADGSMEFLREYGVDYAQGYLIGRPAPELLPAT